MQVEYVSWNYLKREVVLFFADPSNPDHPKLPPGRWAVKK